MWFNVMKNIFIESVNGYMGLDDVMKNAVISLYRTLFEAEEEKEKNDDKKSDDKKGSADSGTNDEENNELNIILNQRPINITPLKDRKIEYIALHYTAGNSSAQGQATKTVFPGNASADFIVDDAEIYQFNPDLDNYYSHAVGVNKPTLENHKQTAKIPGAASLYNQANNRNTISIEMCSNFNGKRPEDASPYDRRFSLSEATLANTAKLVAYLLDKYPNTKVVRHFDITGKPCPAPWCWDEESNQQYYDFVQRCNATPVPKTTNFENVDDALMEKDPMAGWPDFGRAFAPDKTATTSANINSDVTAGSFLNGFIQNMSTPAGKAIANIITKNIGNVNPSVVKEFATMMVNNPEILKNVLKIVPQK